MTSKCIDDFTEVSMFHQFVKEDMSINKIECLWKIHHADEEWFPTKQLSLHKA